MTASLGFRNVRLRGVRGRLFARGCNTFRGSTTPGAMEHLCRGGLDVPYVSDVYGLTSTSGGTRALGRVSSYVRVTFSLRVPCVHIGTCSSSSLRCVHSIVTRVLPLTRTGNEIVLLRASNMFTSATGLHSMLSDFTYSDFTTL